MYLRILKKDLKRKKTMNLIILLFVILSAMFFSSSVNNIISIMGGVDRFIDMAGMKDYVVLISEPESGEPFGEVLDKADGINEWKRETSIRCNSETVKLNGQKLEGFTNNGMVVSDNEYVLHCYDKHNDEITEVEKGSVYITDSLAVKTGIETGDTINFEYGDTKLELKMAGSCKDAVLGSDMVETPRFIINHEDYDKLYSDDTIRSSSRMGIYIIGADDVKDVESVLKNYDNCLFSASRSLIKMTYILKISVAGIIMAVSIFLIIISFAALRFTIGFTISEEFREIGVMKAIGIKNRSIRVLYLVKYFGIALIGSVIGFFAGIPFGNMLLDSVGRDMVLGNDYPVLIGCICSAAVIAMIILFCWGCTAKVKKLSPIDAVRSGQTGERFKKRSLMDLGKSRLGTSGFISINDIISSPKQSILLTTVFTLCTVLIIVLTNTAETLSSDKLMYLISLTDSDVYINLNSETPDIKNGSKTFEDMYTEIENTLSENGMPGKVYVEGTYNVSAEYNGNVAVGRFLLSKETKTTDYFYNEGTAPQYENEVALGMMLAENIGASVGSKVKLTVGGEEKEYVVSALFDSFSNLGMCGRFYETLDVPASAISATMAYQVNFDDDPDADTIEERIEKLKAIYGTENIFNEADYVNDCTKAADATTGAKNLTMIVSVIIITLMSVLLEKSFISKEKSEIALMKAIGFRKNSVVGIHILRFMLIGAVSVTLAVIISDPVTKLIMNPVFSLMGILKGVEYAHNRIETFVIVPLIVFSAVTAGAFFTALTTRKIKASDTANIE